MRNLKFALGGPWGEDVLKSNKERHLQGEMWGGPFVIRFLRSASWTANIKLGDILSDAPKGSWLIRIQGYFQRGGIWSHKNKRGHQRKEKRLKGRGLRFGTRENAFHPEDRGKANEHQKGEREHSRSVWELVQMSQGIQWWKLTLRMKTFPQIAFKMWIVINAFIEAFITILWVELLLNS